MSMGYNHMGAHGPRSGIGPRGGGMNGSMMMMPGMRGMLPGMMGSEMMMGGPHGMMQPGMMGGIGPVPGVNVPFGGQMMMTPSGPVVVTPNGTLPEIPPDMADYRYIHTPSSHPSRVYERGDSVRLFAGCAPGRRHRHPVLRAQCAQPTALRWCD